MNDVFEQIKKNIDKRMDQYTDSRQPTDDEVSIAWLLTELSQVREAARALLQHIEDECVYDEVADDGDGHVDTWCSSEFEALLNKLKEAIK